MQTFLRIAVIVNFELIIETLPQVGIFPISCKTVVDSEYVYRMKEKERFEFGEYVKDNICSKMGHELKPFIRFKRKENGEFQYEVSAAFDIVLPLPSNDEVEEKNITKVHDCWNCGAKMEQIVDAGDENT